MSALDEALAQAAQSLVGCPFRLHGRDPATGLDCVGLVAAALAATGMKAVTPVGYGLRNTDIKQWLPLAQRAGLQLSRGPLAAGEVLLLTLAHCQHHLVIATDRRSVVHAHAGLRRVVRQPLDTTWQVEAKWRLAPTSEG
jgi:hypothetical protein